MMWRLVLVHRRHLPGTWEAASALADMLHLEAEEAAEDVDRFIRLTRASMRAGKIALYRMRTEQAHPLRHVAAPRCTHEFWTGGPQCTLSAGHPNYHLYRCAGQHCPGLPWPASAEPHPVTCR